MRRKIQIGAKNVSFRERRVFKSWSGGCEYVNTIGVQRLALADDRPVDPKANSTSNKGMMVLRRALSASVLSVPLFGLVLAFQDCSGFTAALHAAGVDYCAGNRADAACLSSVTATCVFDGQVIAEKQSVVSFLTSTVPTGSSCASEKRTCLNGGLSGSYAYASCSVGIPAACLFNGKTIASGTSVKAYLQGSSGNCTSEDRVCTNGQLSGSYAYATCKSTHLQASCLFNGMTVPHGQAVTAYPVSSVAAGQSCAPSTRVCLNGALSGAGEFATCSPQAASSCLFNGMTIPSGGSVTAYMASTVPAGQACQPVVRNCANGVLSGSGDYGSCTTNAPASCLLNGATIPNGGSAMTYFTTSGPRNIGCATETRVCSNGTLSGSATQTSCSVNPSCYQTGGLAPISVCHTTADEGVFFQPADKDVGYAAQVFKLGPQNFRTIYHSLSRAGAEAGLMRPGDSIKAGGQPGPFTYQMPTNMRFVIWGSMTDPLSVLYYGPQSATQVSGGGNPMTIGGLPGDPYFYTFFLSVTNNLNWSDDANYVHFFNMARTLDFVNYDILGTDPGNIRAWHPFSDGVPDWQLRPANLTDTSGFGINGAVPTRGDNTQGLIGSVTYANGLYYYFYTDRDPAQPSTMRLYYRSSANISGGAWSPAALASDEVFHDISVVMVHKAKGRDRWAVSYTCYNNVTGESDICIQYTANLNVRGAGGISDLQLYQAPGARSNYYLGVGIKACSSFAGRGQLYSMTDTMGALASPDGEDSINRGGFITWVDGACKGTIFGAPIYRAGWDLQ
jgi:hypothetical protein